MPPKGEDQIESASILPRGPAVEVHGANPLRGGSPRACAVCRDPCGSAGFALQVAEGGAVWLCPTMGWRPRWVSREREAGVGEEVEAVTGELAGEAKQGRPWRSGCEPAAALGGSGGGSLALVAWGSGGRCEECGWVVEVGVAS